jgi:hypothetical protein
MLSPQSPQSLRPIGHSGSYVALQTRTFVPCLAGGGGDDGQWAVHAAGAGAAAACSGCGRAGGVLACAAAGTGFRVHGFVYGVGLGAAGGLARAAAGIGSRF